MTASRQSPVPHLASLPELLSIPADTRFHEILDGELVQKTAPAGEHALAQGGVVSFARQFHRSGGSSSGGWWILPEATIWLSMHDIVQPDVAGWRRERMPQRPQGYPLRLRPDWVCEVMTDSDSRRRDAMQKLRLYAVHGIPHYWLLDTERERLTVLGLTEHGYEELQVAGCGDLVAAEPFGDVLLDVGELFGYEPRSTKSS
jgi:Uma2 family endonuclease